MKNPVKIIVKLIVGCVLACCLSQNVNAQILPPGGGGGDGGGGFTNSYSYVPNTNFLIAVQETNIVLNWRSSTNKIFLLEHRATLTGATQWGELTNYYLSPANTNWTKYIHKNIVRSKPTDFYRLFDVTPVANPDFFGVDQDSSANQLNIFQNDSSPNDDLFYITNLVSALHGSISYTLDASTFEYTPDSGFYGVDTFSYSITSKHGEISSNAVVKVFVNQTGNNPPSVPDITIILQTNVYTATFNALTNATDPDGDTNILFSVGSPSLGSISNNANGNIAYTRNPSLYGSDAFTYIITDGNGGYGVGSVKILQVDTDGDGMPDQWEIANGLDPFSDDSMDDSDADGLPNLAEFVLGTNPHASDNLLNLSSVMNGTQFGGYAQIPILGLRPTIPIPPISFYVNSNRADHSIMSQAPDGQWLLNWDTAFLTNGTYQVQLACQVAPMGSPDSISDIFGTPKTVQIGNPITFDRLTSQFTDFLLIVGT